MSVVANMSGVSEFGRLYEIVWWGKCVVEGFVAGLASVCQERALEHGAG